MKRLLLCTFVLLTFSKISQAYVRKSGECVAQGSYVLIYDMRGTSRNYHTYTLYQHDTAIEHGSMANTTLVETSWNKMSFYTKTENTPGPESEIISVIKDVKGFRAVHVPRQIDFTCE